MSTGLMSSSARASATDRLTTRQSSSTCCGPPTPVSTSTAPRSWVTTNPCTGQRSPSGPSRLARCRRLISSGIRSLFAHRLPPVNGSRHISIDPDVSPGEVGNMVGYTEPREGRGRGGPRLVHWPPRRPFLLAGLVALAVLVAMVQVGVFSYVFARLGIAPGVALLLLLGSLIGSAVNVPVARFRNRLVEVRGTMS